MIPLTADTIRKELVSSARAGVALSLAHVGEAELPGDALAEALWSMGGEEQARGIHIEGLAIAGDVDLSHIRWSGPLRIMGCSISGDFALDHARIDGLIDLTGTKLVTISMSYATIVGTVGLSEIVATRGFYALGCSISGGLRLRGALLIAPEDKIERSAVELYRANIGDVYVTKASMLGGLYANGCTVTRSFRLSGSELCNRASLGFEQGNDASDGLEMSGANIGANLNLCSSQSGLVRLTQGSIRLRNVTCKNLRVSRTHLKETTDLEGLTYLTLQPNNATGDLFASGADILECLEVRVPAPGRAYRQLADFADSVGDDRLKRRALVRRQERFTFTGSHARISALRHRLSGLTIGYGYAPGRAVAWLLGCVIAAVLVIQTSPGVVSGSKPGGPHSLSWPAAVQFTVDQIAPFSSSGFADQWAFSPHGFWPWCVTYLFVGLKFLSWALAAVAIAAVTGTVRPRQ